MKPQILFQHDKDGVSQGYLVDMHSIFYRPDPHGYSKGKFTESFVAIELQELKAGDVTWNTKGTARISDGMLCVESQTLVAPFPRVLAVIKTNGMKIASSLQARNINPKAAEVLLKMAASYLNVQLPMDGSKKWSFGEPKLRNRENDPDVIPWNTYRFLAAWKWSHWRLTGMNGAQRLADMQSVGYCGTANALRDMLSDMELVATKRK
jgi:hypothetical protein